MRHADKFGRRDLPCCGGERNTLAEGTLSEPQGLKRKRWFRRSGTQVCLPSLFPPPLDLSPLPCSFLISFWSTRIFRGSDSESQNPVPALRTMPSAMQPDSGAWLGEAGFSIWTAARRPVCGPKSLQVQRPG